jgi:DnaJ-domain-containing protein 1
VGAGLLSIGALVGAALVSIRGDWEVGLGLAAVGLGLLAAARLKRGGHVAGGVAPMSLSEARSILGVTAEATEAEVRAAYSRLMRLAHPDRGGTNGLAAQLNAARDRLLEGR